MQSLFFLIVLLPPILYAVGNLLDKQLIHKGGPSSPALIVIVSSLLSIFVVPTIYFFAETKIPESLDILLMVISGIFTAISVFLYLKALEGESVFSVAPALQLSPVFSYAFGLIVFQEFLSIPRIFGCILIITGSFLLTLRIEKIKERDSFKLNIFFLTFLSSFFLATSGAFFKFFADKYGYWTVQLYEYVGLFFLGACSILFLPQMRNRIFEMISFKKRKSFTILNIITEGVMVSGDFVLNYIVLVVPLVVVFSFNATQPLFLLILGLLIKKISELFNLNIQIGYYASKTILFTVIITIGAIMVILF